MASPDARRRSFKQLIYACLGVIALVFLVMLSASITARISVGHAVSALGDQLLPIRNQSSELSRAYVNQETGQRGYLLTGDPVTLEPYDAGTATSERVAPLLRQELSHAPHSEELLKLFDAELAAAAAWKGQAADPQIAAQRAGTIPRDQLNQMVLDGKHLFDELRERFRALNAQIDSLMADELQHIGSVQRMANIVQIVAAIVLAATIVGVVVAVRQMLTRPVTRLVSDVRAVADGDYSQPICRAGPREIGEVAAAVKDMRDKLEQLARFDTVTGLANRAETTARFTTALESLRVSDAGLGVLFCDIDHFKDVNDTWGHAVGDAVLSTVAARIRECVSLEDTVGRIGGDEILVLLPGMKGLDEVAATAEKIRCRIAEPITQFGRTVHITLSIGATQSLPGESAAAITARADTAMYHAKQAGRNVVIRIDR